MYRVPVLTYLSLAAEVRLEAYKLKHQRVSNGFVLFDTPSEISRLGLLIESHNSGVPMPYSETEYDGPSLIDHLDILVGVKSMNADWYACQCPSCASAGGDNKQNNLQFSRMGFRCMAGCAGKEVIMEFNKLIPAATDIELERGQTTLDTGPKVMDGRLVFVSDTKEQTIEVEEVSGGFSIKIININKETGGSKKETHVVKKSNLRTLWVWLIKNCPVGETVESSQIRAFLAEKHGVDIDAWASHTKRTIYFETHYYPLKVLQWKRLIDYNLDGSVTLLKEEFE
jgi:hypothetical protein